MGDELAFTSVRCSPMKMIEYYRQSEYLCDVVIISEDGQRFPAHRVVLAAASEFFSRMFRENFLESKTTEIVVRNVDGAAMKILMDFAYKSETTCPEAVENVLSLYEAAHYTLFDELFEMCSGWLKRHVDTSNCLRMAIVADRYDDSDLRRVADCISAVNILVLTESDDFLCLPVEHLSRIISQDDLGVKSEDDVLIVVQKWVKHDEVSRRDHVGSLSKFIRFPLLDFEETSGVLSDLDLVSHYHSSDGSYHHRVGCEGVLLICGGVERKREELAESREFVVGHMLSSEARIYNANSDTWSEFPSLSVETSGHRIATSCGVLYSLGGFTYCGFNDGGTSGNVTDVVQRYDCEQREWVNDVQPMSCQREGYEIVSCASRIYGMSIEECCMETMCEVFDPDQKRWITVSSPDHSLLYRYILSVLDNKVIAIGYNRSRELGYMKRMYMLSDHKISIYEERANKWDDRLFQGHSLWNFACEVVDRKLMTFV
ncbi:kelch-like protein 20 [Oscarella lobularis]|uniref:kelch-like protein 20 n=1 Tax=Oscarella lobularis TaxID=121494 RepID=UPI0033131152